MSMKLGRIGEQTVIGLFNSAGISTVKETDLSKKYDHDLICKIDEKDFTCEVKFDAMACETGNLAIEYHNSRQDKPSGISVTKAKLWAHLIKDGDNIVVFIVKTKKLKDFIKENKPFKEISFGGDKNSEMWLYKTNDILPIFTRVDNLKTEDILKTVRKVLK